MHTARNMPEYVTTGAIQKISDYCYKTIEKKIEKIPFIVGSNSVKFYPLKESLAAVFEPKVSDLDSDKPRATAQALSRLTGHGHHTITKKLKDLPSIKNVSGDETYDVPSALPILFSEKSAPKVATYASYAELERLTGVTHKTLSKRLASLVPENGFQDGETSFFIKDALPLIFLDPRLDLNAEKAKLTKLQAEKINLELARMRGEVVDAAEFHSELSKKIVAFRDALRNMALKVAGQVSECSSTEENYETILTAVDEALHELSL